MKLGAWRIAALGLCDPVGDKESPGYEFSSPFSFNTLMKWNWRRNADCECEELRASPTNALSLLFGEKSSLNL